MVHASLFTGIGACEMAAQRLGWANAFTCEIDDFCNEILKYHYPNTVHYGNVKETDFRFWRGKIDILTAGCPCQPVSSAGQRKGTEDDRFLWPELFRTIREIRPTWVIAENVVGILSMVEPREGIEVESGADIFNEAEFCTIRKDERYITDWICESIEKEGYRVVPIVIPACSVGAPHERNRVWFIANAYDARLEGMQGREDGADRYGLTVNALRNGWAAERADSSIKEKDAGERLHLELDALRFGEERIVADAHRKHGAAPREGGSDERQNKRLLRKTDKGGVGIERPAGRFDVLWCDACSTDEYPQGKYANFPTQSPICSRNDGFSARLHNIAFSKWRAESLKAYGNSMNVDVVYEIFRAIDKVETIVKILYDDGG